MAQTITVHIWAPVVHFEDGKVWHYASDPAPYTEESYTGAVDGLHKAIATYRPYVLFAGATTYIVPPQVLAQAYIEVVIEGEP